MSGNVSVGCSAELALGSYHRRIRTECMGLGSEVDDGGGDGNADVDEDTHLSDEVEKEVVADSLRIAMEEDVLILILAEFSLDEGVAKDEEGGQEV